MGNTLECVGNDVSIRVAGVWSNDFNTIVLKMYELVCDEYRELLAGNVLFINVISINESLEVRFYTPDLSVTVVYLTGDPVGGWEEMSVFTEYIDYASGMSRDLLPYLDFKNWGLVELASVEADLECSYDVLKTAIESNTDDVWLKDVKRIDSYVVDGPSSENELYVYTDSLGNVTEIEVTFEIGDVVIVGTRKGIV